LSGVPARGDSSETGQEISQNGCCMAYETLDIAIGEDRVGVITLSRPAARNAMSTRMMEELRACFADFYVNPDAAA
jgi:enoyl-CoA hydratase/carnithine racemase